MSVFIFLLITISQCTIRQGEAGVPFPKHPRSYVNPVPSPYSQPLQFLHIIKSSAFHGSNLVLHQLPGRQRQISYRMLNKGS